MTVDVGHKHNVCPTLNQEVETALQFLQPQAASGNKPPAGNPASQTFPFNINYYAKHSFNSICCMFALNIARL